MQTAGNSYKHQVNLQAVVSKNFEPHKWPKTYTI